jgi:hypothetical protein
VSPPPERIAPAQPVRRCITAGFRRSIVELMRRIRRDVHSVAAPHHRLLPAERRLDLAFQHNKSLFKIMPVRCRASAGRNMHIDDAKPSARIRARDRNRVRVPHQPDVRQALIVLDMGDAHIVSNHRPVMPDIQPSRQPFRSPPIGWLPPHNAKAHPSAWYTPPNAPSPTALPMSITKHP